MTRPSLLVAAVLLLGLAAHAWMRIADRRRCRWAELTGEDE